MTRATNRGYTDQLGRDWRIQPTIPADTMCEYTGCPNMAEIRMTLAEHDVYVCVLHPDLVTVAWFENEPAE